MKTITPDILIIAQEENPNVHYILNHLQSYNYYLWNIASFPVHVSCSVRLGQDKTKPFLIDLQKDEYIALDSLKSVWWYNPSIPIISSDIQDTNQKKFAFVSCCQFIDGLSYILDCLWVNQPIRQEIATNLLYQVQIAKLAGFDTLETLVTNHRDSLAFAQNFRLLYLPLQPWEKPQDLMSENLSLDNLDLAPCFFQQMPNNNISLLTTLVIGTQIYSAFQYEEVDGTYKYTPNNLPADIEKKIFALAQMSGLIYFRIYFLKDNNEKYYFLSMDVSPSLLELPIFLDLSCEIFINLLVHGKGANSHSFWPTLATN